MSRLAIENQRITLDATLVECRPTLRAAIRLGRLYGAPSAMLRSIAEGSITVLSDVIRECAIDRPSVPDPLFETGTAGIYRNIAALQAPAAQLVYDLAGFDPLDDLEDEADEEENEEPSDDAPASKPVTFVERMTNLFGFATGILRWTPEEAFDATPSEIIAAYRFRERSYAPKKDEPKGDTAIRVGFADLQDKFVGKEAANAA
ncbi:hypothetical protein [Aurantimonas sp. 22II-16-19i]|uniref:hypothetical protein n=1 Tax=Aurantimonas sp. 22II-16-19i TaxID=1317114 RepID=UPI0009F8A1C0|nr:hypothetical protein [Aurantimonas sp. 22II-16-19i]